MKLHFLHPLWKPKSEILPHCSHVNIENVNQKNVLSWQTTFDRFSTTAKILSHNFSCCFLISSCVVCKVFRNLFSSFYAPVSTAVLELTLSQTEFLVNTVKKIGPPVRFALSILWKQLTTERREKGGPKKGRQKSCSMEGTHINKCCTRRLWKKAHALHI